jgi:hypothetical protein
MGESEKFWNSWNFQPGIFEVFEDKNLTLPFYNYYPNLKDSFIIAFIEIQVETLLWILKIKNRQQMQTQTFLPGRTITNCFWTNNTKTHTGNISFLASFSPIDAILIFFTQPRPPPTVF